MDLSLAAIFRRDGGICWVCEKPVWEESTHPLYRPSRDHIIPRKDGGKSTAENLKLAHQGCNSNRHALPKTSTKKRKEGRVSARMHYGWILRDGEVRQWGGLPIVHFQGRDVVFRDGRPYPIQFEISFGNDDQLLERYLDVVAA